MVCTTLNGWAQKGTVKAAVWDAEAGAGIPGAVVEVVSKRNPSDKKFYTSGYGGEFSMPSLAYGEYTLSASFLGYETVSREFKLSQATLNLGRIEIRPSATQIDVVVKEVQALRTSQRGDTLSYNAAAFKVAADADVEGLLKKMTGINITNGVVEVQGEEVKKVFVDGKEFFGEDVTTAIKSLPAEAVDRVEVFNKPSDQAEFSGMDDGEGYKALNIVTHSNMRQGQFGKVYAGGGYDFENDEARYLAGGNVNIFHGDSRLSFIGLFNNVNQQNFSFEDILGVNGGGGGGRGRGVGAYMVRPQDGVALVNAIGMNYSDSWGKKDQVSFQGSYFFNHTRTENESWRERFSEYYEEDVLQRDTLEEWGESLTKNMNHRLNARLEWKISPNQSLMSRTWLSYQGNTPENYKYGYQWGNSGYSQLYDKSASDRQGYNLSEFLQYRAKLGKDGRTITVDGNVRYRNNERTSDSWANEADPYLPAPGEVVVYPYPYPSVELLYQHLTEPTSSLDLRGNFTYTEPVSKFAQVSLQYRFGYEKDESDRRSYTEDMAGVLALNPILSNTHTSTYTSHQVGPGFRWSKERNTFVANIYYQHSNLEGVTIYPTQDRIRQDYDHLTYFMMLNMQFNPQNSIRLFVNSRTQEPSINNLQDVYNLSNPQYISKGNSALDPSYSHNVRLHYVNSNVEKGRTFMWMAMMTNTQDYISSNVEYGKEVVVDGVAYHPLQYTEPVNLDGQWWLRTHISYGLPLNFMKCNFNMMAGVNYSITPNLINGERNDASNMGYDANFTLGSNISEKIDFTVSWNGTYNVAKNSLLAKEGNNEYFNHSASASLKWTFWKGFTLTANASYSQYLGVTNDYNEQYVLCNLYLGKKFLKNQRAEVQIGVNDLLNQNQAFARTTGSGWVQNATNSVIGRYYMVNLVFNLRHFGKKGSTNINDYEGVGASGQRRPMSPPHGGPHRF